MKNNKSSKNPSPEAKAARAWIQKLREQDYSSVTLTQINKALEQEINFTLESAKTLDTKLSIILIVLPALVAAFVSFLLAIDTPLWISFALGVLVFFLTLCCVIGMYPRKYQLATIPFGGMMYEYNGMPMLKRIASSSNQAKEMLYWKLRLAYHSYNLNMKYNRRKKWIFFVTSILIGLLTLIIGIGLYRSR